jgi:hypothetical protein
MPYEVLKVGGLFKSEIPAEGGAFHFWKIPRVFKKKIQ